MGRCRAGVCPKGPLNKNIKCRGDRRTCTGHQCGSRVHEFCVMKHLCAAMFLRTTAVSKRKPPIGPQSGF